MLMTEFSSKLKESKFTELTKRNPPSVTATVTSALFGEGELPQGHFLSMRSHHTNNSCFVVTGCDKIYLITPFYTALFGWNGAMVFCFGDCLMDQACIGNLFGLSFMALFLHSTFPTPFPSPAPTMQKPPHNNHLYACAVWMVCLHCLVSEAKNRWVSCNKGRSYVEVSSGGRAVELQKKQI